MTPFTRNSAALEKKLIRNAAMLNKAFATGLRPPPRISVDEWASTYRRFPDDSAYAGKWKHETAPYLVEIMAALSPHDPTPVVSIIKCAQSGGSASGENWLGYIADLGLGPTMYVGPTISAAKDWLAEKFWPMIEASPKLNPDKGGAIMPRRQKDGDGTTALRVRFRRGGWLLIAGANSAATLRQHSIKNIIEDDLDQFPDDLDNQGSPEAMIDARLTVYKRNGLSKRLKISTPTNEGASKIERADKKSDQRRYYFKCQECGSRFEPEFEQLDWPKSPVERPDQAYLVAPCCGGIHYHWQKSAMSTVDGWCPTIEIDGEKAEKWHAEQVHQAIRSRETGCPNKGFSIPGIMSTFLSWGDMASSWIEARGDVNALRAWTNLKEGKSFAIKGDAPPSEELEMLKEQDWGRGTVLPWGPTIFTLGCDVQGDGIYFEAVGWGFGLENWSLDNGFLPGATDVAGQGAWALLEDYVRKTTFTTPGGRSFPFDMVCVDAGYNTEAAKAFCKRSAKRLPVFGRDGWSRPILGRGQAIHYDFAKKSKNTRGKPKKKAGEEAHLVGTYSAKLSFYGQLKASLTFVKDSVAGQRPDPVRGRVHFSRDATKDFFEQLTSESCVIQMKAGQPVRVWVPEKGKQNHWLDCRIYNRAAHEALGVGGRSEHDWNVTLSERYAPVAPEHVDLLTLMNQPLASPAPEPESEPVEETYDDQTDANLRALLNQTNGQTWLPQKENWINART